MGYQFRNILWNLGVEGIPHKWTKCIAYMPEILQEFGKKTMRAIHLRKYLNCKVFDKNQSIIRKEVKVSIFQKLKWNNRMLCFLETFVWLNIQLSIWFRNKSYHCTPRRRLKKQKCQNSQTLHAFVQSFNLWKFWNWK